MQALFVPYLQILGWILLPIAAGVLLRKIGLPRVTAKVLFMVVLFGCQMPIAMLAVWKASIGSGSWSLPLLALVGWMLAAGVGMLVSRVMEHDAKHRGAFVVSMAISNHGYTLTGIVAMVLFGDAGLSQATYAHFLAVPFITFVCFPIGRFFGNDDQQTTVLKVVAKSLTDVRSLPMVAMLIGLGLNISGTERPEWCGEILPWLVYSGTSLCGAAIGFLFSGLHLRRFMKENIFSFVYRSTVYPLVYLGLALVMALDKLDTRILLLFGLAPAGLYANLVAEFFGLDTDMTTSVFVVSTLVYLLVVLPVFAAVVV